MLLDLNYNMKQLMKPNYFLEFAGSRLSERPPWEELEARGDRGVDSCCSRHCSMVEYHGVSLHIVTKTSIPSPFEYPGQTDFPQHREPAQNHANPTPEIAVFPSKCLWRIMMVCVYNQQTCTCSH
jgi:hypothetical protein